MVRGGRSGGAQSSGRGHSSSSSSSSSSSRSTGSSRSACELFVTKRGRQIIVSNASSNGQYGYVGWDYIPFPDPPPRSTVVTSGGPRGYVEVLDGFTGQVISSNVPTPISLSRAQNRSGFPDLSSSSLKTAGFRSATGAAGKYQADHKLEAQVWKSALQRSQVSDYDYSVIRSVQNAASNGQVLSGEANRAKGRLTSALLAGKPSFAAADIKNACFQAAEARRVAEQCHKLGGHYPGKILEDQAEKFELAASAMSVMKDSSRTVENRISAVTGILGRYKDIDGSDLQVPRGTPKELRAAFAKPQVNKLDFETLYF